MEELAANTKKISLPNGASAVIREQNGNDEDIISNEADNQTGLAFSKYIQAVVVDYNGQGKLSLEDATKLKNRVKYVIMIQTRILSFGPIVKWDYQWPKEKTPTSYVEDLSRYVWDYDKDFPYDTDHEDYDQERIAPYEDGDAYHRELTLSSQKHVRYRYYNGEAERYMLELESDRKSRNSVIKARALELMVDDKWMKVENFGQFSSRDMAELRSDIQKRDRMYDLITLMPHPKDDTAEMPVPIISAETFFFPVLIET